MPEQWKHVWGFSRYMVSDMGRIKSRETGLFLVQDTAKDGHKIVVVTANNGTKMVKKVARLVADTFDWVPDGYSQIYHEDGDKFNNRRSNLRRYIEHGDPEKRKHQKKQHYFGLEDDPETKQLIKDLEEGRKSKKAPLVVTAPQFHRFSEVMCNETGDIYESQADVCRAFGIDASSLSKMLRGKRNQKTIKGKTFSFVDGGHLIGQYVSIRLVETGETFRSISEAARTLGLDRSSLSKQLRGVKGYKQLKGYTFEYIFPDGARQTKALPRGKKARRVRVKETGVIYPSQTACAKAMGTWQSAISAVLRGEHEQHHGFTFEYVDDDA